MKCQICNGESRLVFLKEKNVSCGDYFDGKRLYERNLGATPLLECRNCGFAYFSEMHGWTENKYRIEIYNENYGLCDPPFKQARPRKLAAWLSNILEPVDLIDFGGGEGQLAGLLVGKGFNARCYDPFYGPRQLPNGDAEVVTAFEIQRWRLPLARLDGLDKQSQSLRHARFPRVGYTRGAVARLPGSLEETARGSV